MSRSMVSAIKTLSGYGLLEVNEHRQFRLMQPNDAQMLIQECFKQIKGD
jgi:hypothetical protein